MAISSRQLLAALAAALVGGVAMYLAQFLSAGPSPASIQLLQLQRALISTLALGLAAAAGYGTIPGDGFRRSTATVAAGFLLAAIVGYGVGVAALWLAPPAGFTLGSRWLTFTLVILQEAVPFALAGFAGAAVRSTR